MHLAGSPLRRRFSPIVIGVAVSGLAIVSLGFARAQTKDGGVAPSQTKAKASGASNTPANLSQLMKGIFYPNSNVIFAAQATNPADIKQDKDASTAVNPLASAYGKWEAVENSSLALAEAARLLTVPGRKCANGLPVPMANADWNKLVQGVREAGLKSYQAAKNKNQDQILDAADVLTTACSNCHDKYREKPALADRCK
jgi:hypothetical protein